MEQFVAVPLPVHYLLQAFAWLHARFTGHYLINNSIHVTVFQTTICLCTKFLSNSFSTFITYLSYFSSSLTRDDEEMGQTWPISHGSSPT